MRVQPITSQQCFMGLWQTSESINIGSGSPQITERKEYHPYADEPDEFIKTIDTKKEVSSKIIGDGETPYAIEKTKETKIGERLNFTEEEYFKYKREYAEGKPMSALGRFVNNELKAKNLFEFMNINPEQKETLFSSVKNTLNRMVRLVAKRA